MFSIQGSLFSSVTLLGMSISIVTNFPFLN
jgi:hypothetical protein